MKVVLLTRTREEALRLAQDAQIPSDEVWAPSRPDSLNGVVLEEEDLVIEFPGFRERGDADAIVRAVLESTNPEGAGPRWEKAGSAS